MSSKRSKWKGIVLKSYIHNYIKNYNNKAPLKIFNRSSIILPSAIGTTFEVYNGFKFNKMLITENMIGHKFGEFSNTKKRNVYKKK